MKYEHDEIIVGVIAMLLLFIFFITGFFLLNDNVNSRQLAYEDCHYLHDVDKTGCAINECYVLHNVTNEDRQNKYLQCQILNGINSRS